MDVTSLVAQLPPGVVATDAEALAEASRDWWPLAWLRRSRGAPPALPSAVVRPRSAAEVSRALRWAHSTRTPVVARGGGSGVAGGAAVQGGEIVLDMSSMSAVLHVDEGSRIAVVQAGVRGDALEDALRPRGLTLGHYPQSLPISSVGGWIATSGMGHASFGFGPIERRVLGLVVALADGRTLTLRAVPRSAAGPDLRRLFVGSEGTLGVIIEATLSLAAAAGPHRWSAFRLPTFPAAMAVCRAVAQAGLPALIVRAYDEQDAAMSLGVDEDPAECALIAAFDGGSPNTDAGIDALTEIAERHGGRPAAPDLGLHWWRHHRDALELFRAVMGEERAWGDGVILDTVEVAGLWHGLPALYDSVRAALAATAEVVACHISHLHASGGSLYFTFVLRAADDRSAEAAYLRLWSEAVAACHAAGGTMSHHHGVGRLKAPFMEAEVGAEGLEALRGIKQALDPHGILNPGTLLPIG